MPEIAGACRSFVAAGSAYHIEREKVHDAKVSATGGAAKVLAVYIVDKGKPIAEPAK